MKTHLLFILSLASFGIALYFFLKSRQEQQALKLKVLDVDTLAKLNQSVDSFNKKELERLQNIAKKAEKKAKTLSLITGIGAGVIGAAATILTGGAAAPFIPAFAGLVTAGTTAANKQTYKRANDELSSSKAIQLSNY